MNALWIVEECKARKWRPARMSDYRIGDFIQPNEDEEEGLTELALWQAEGGRYRLVKYVPEQKGEE